MKKDLNIGFRNLIEKFLAFLLFILFFPAFIVIGAIIAFESKGSIIFSQKRIGKNRRKFTFYKFRTMYADAKTRYPKLYEYKYSLKEIETMKFKIEDDPRLTRFGRYLRRTSLDEIPNLINVIKGDMALIGPRPEIPEMLKYYKKDQLKKFSAKPGVTGLAQVQGRGYLKFQETINYDLEYVENQSLSLDLEILLKTVLTVLRGTGAF